MDHSLSDLRKLRQALLDGEDASILELARKKKRLLSWLTALTFDTHPNVRQRAVSLTGRSAAIVFQYDAEFIRNYLLRLFWLINDESGGVVWQAPELIGEILFHCPQLCQFFPLLISLLDLEQEDIQPFLPGILWAIGRVAQVDRAGMLPALARVQAYATGEGDAAIRQMARWCLQQLDDPPNERTLPCEIDHR